MASHPLKRSVVRLLRYRSLGAPAAVACLRLGAWGVARKIARECGYIAPVVEIDVPPAVAGGARFRMDSAQGRDQVARGIWFFGWDGFEKPMPDLFGACSREADRVLDVGAYSGFYAMLAATCSPRADVVAFEPFPLVRETLARNLALNGLSGRIRIIPAALGDKPGPASFYIPENRDGWIETASSLDGQFCGRHEAVISVDVTTLDTFRFESAGVGPVNLIKLDAELSEHRVLDGARRLLAEDRPLVFLEILPGNPFCPQIEAIREQAGYLAAAIHPQGIDGRDRVEAVDIGNLYASNQVLCPAGKADRLEHVARSLGYRVSRNELAGPIVPGGEARAAHA